MIPSAKWFPSSLQNRAAWFDNFNTQFLTVFAPLGFVAADQTALNNDNSAVQFMAATALTIESLTDAVRQYRIILTEGDIGDPTPIFPEFPNLVPPISVATGIFERLDKLIRRIKAAPAYTNEIGALLGIIPSSTPTPESEPKPAIKASESFSNFKFSLNVTRMGFQAFKVQIQRAGSETWTDAAFATSNPCEVIVTPTTAGQPERVLVRALLMEKNAPIGQPSDPTFVTVNP